MLKNRSGIFLFSLAGVFVAVMLMTAIHAAPVRAEDEIPAGVSTSAAETTDVEDVTPAPEEMSSVPAEAVEHEKTKEKLGFPQLNTATYPSQIFWLFVSFGLLYTLMSKIALPRITEVLDMRQTQRESNLNRAGHLSEEAEKVKSAYEASLAKAQTEAQAKLSAMEQANSERTSAEIGRFMENARKRIATAEQGIARAKEEALISLADISAEVAVDMVEKIADVQISKADAKKIVLTEMQRG